MATVGIVTGAGRGMGRACADRVVQMVDTLLVVDLDAESAAAAADELAASGAHVEPVTLDVTDRAGLAALAERVAALGTLRAVAHAAGISPTMADWRRIFAVDLVGTALLAEALRPLTTAGTATVCFASTAPYLMGVQPDAATDALFDDPLHPEFLDRVHETFGTPIEYTGLAYSWAKYGVQRFVRREAVRIGPLGGRICSVSPGIIDTPQGRQEAASTPEMAVMVERTPLAREGRAEELAATVAFLLSDEASFLTGTDLVVDGGVCAAMTLPPV
jgi:NAD(P)-dependent dehydrogenase (short-subunit alcohol dehydrogenase family)